MVKRRRSLFPLNKCSTYVWILNFSIDLGWFRVVSLLKFVCFITSLLIFWPFSFKNAVNWSFGAWTAFGVNQTYVQRFFQPVLFVWSSNVTSSLRNFRIMMEGKKEVCKQISFSIWRCDVSVKLKNTTC